MYLLLLPARAMVFGVIFQAACRVDLVWKRAIGTLLLNGVLSYFLIKYYGISGAAVGTIIVFWLYVVPYCVFYCSRLTGISMRQFIPYRLFVKISLCVVGVVVFVLNASSWTLLYGNVSRIFLMLSLYFMLLVVCIYIFERNLFKKSLALVYHKFKLM